MKLDRAFVFLCAGLVFLFNTASAETASGDPFADWLFPPDLILHNGEAIGLSDQQRQQILSRVEKEQARFQELEQALHKEQDAMVELLDRDQPEETAILKRLDNLIARERDIRREQFGLMLALRNLLTAEQQTRLKALRKTYNPPAMEARLKEKVARIEAGVQKIVNGGGDPSSITGKMQRFPELMRVGKVKEAEGLLDRVLTELEAE
jgi:Spy/CpxP family protein refolding chaperone